MSNDTPKARKPAKKKTVADAVKQDVENGSRKAILEDLFYDFHRSRKQIYLMNFIRGFVLAWEVFWGQRYYSPFSSGY